MSLRQSVTGEFLDVLMDQGSQAALEFLDKESDEDIGYVGACLVGLIESFMEYASDRGVAIDDALKKYDMTSDSIEKAH